VGKCPIPVSLAVPLWWAVVEWCLAFAVEWCFFLPFLVECFLLLWWDDEEAEWCEEEAEWWDAVAVEMLWWEELREVIVVEAVAGMAATRVEAARAAVMKE
jgi:hypothetical protein